MIDAVMYLQTKILSTELSWKARSPWPVPLVVRPAYYLCPTQYNARQTQVLHLLSACANGKPRASYPPVSSHSPKHWGSKSPKSLCMGAFLVTTSHMPDTFLCGKKCGKENRGKRQKKFKQF